MKVSPGQREDRIWELSPLSRGDEKSYALKQEWFKRDRRK